jgi:pyrroline-5-carboxylate reductase
MSFDGRRVAFIGGGMMGTAMIGGLLGENLLRPKQIVVADPNVTRGAYLVETYGLTHTMDNAEAVRNADVVVVAVKPQFFEAVADDVRGRVSQVEVVVSVMAGVNTETIGHKLEVNPVVRAMPNTPGAIGQGMTAWVATDAVSDTGVELAELLLGALGETLRVPKETYLDMATAVSGSGPAYVFLFMEAMVDAAVHMGFARSDAEKLVLQTVRGAVAYADESDASLGTLRHQVTSPGGTTAEALYHMEREGLRGAVARGMWAAFQRSVALGGGEPRDPDTSV